VAISRMEKVNSCQSKKTFLPVGRKGNVLVNKQRSNYVKTAQKSLQCKAGKLHLMKIH